MNHILEINKRASKKSGRVGIKMSLLTIHDDPNAVQENGTHWEEKYVQNAMETAKLMPICADFLTEDKDIPSGHGFVDVVENEKGLLEPNYCSETVGVIEDCKIEEITVRGKKIKALVGTGFLYNQRYKNFVNWVRKNVANGTVSTSIEITGLEANNNDIVYEGKRTEDFKVPKEFAFSGVAIISVPPGDSNAIVTEINTAKQNGALSQKEKEENVMELKEIKELIVNTISEINSKNELTDKEISKYTDEISAKEQTITELNAKVDDLNTKIADNEKVVSDKDAMIAELNSKLESAKAELDECKKAEKVNELNEAIKDFSDEDKKCVEVELNAFNKDSESYDPFKYEIAEITNKIYANIGKNSREAEKKAVEMNSKKESIDIYSGVNTASDSNSDDGSVSIY